MVPAIKVCYGFVRETTPAGFLHWTEKKKNKTLSDIIYVYINYSYKTLFPVEPYVTIYTISALTLIDSDIYAFSDVHKG